MAKAFSLVSWNVEHFKKEGDRVARVVDLVNAQRPDVFALYEVEGKGRSSSMRSRDGCRVHVPHHGR